MHIFDPITHMNPRIKSAVLVVQCESVQNPKDLQDFGNVRPVEKESRSETDAVAMTSGPGIRVEEHDAMGPDRLWSAGQLRNVTAVPNCSQT
jgi:hypothetical protein